MLRNPLASCCERLESLAEALSLAAGPTFVALAVFLLIGCIAAYFEVVFFYRFKSSSYESAGWALSVYMIYCFSFHYYAVIRTSPGSPRDARQPTYYETWLHKLLTVNKRHNHISRKAQKAVTAAHLASMSTQAELSTRQQRMLGRVCKKCPPIRGQAPYKPERCHHCRVCATCILGYDHHCPWINSCVGIHNQRYFVLFMVYLAASATLVVCWGRKPLEMVLVARYNWPFHTPRLLVLLTLVLSLVIGLALFVMVAWQLWLVARGETTVESSDNAYYRKVAKIRGRQFSNPYHLGVLTNLLLFFNLAPTRRDSHWLSLLVPLYFPPHSDGFTWPKKEGFEASILDFDDELTDED